MQNNNKIFKLFVSDDPKVIGTKEGNAVILSDSSSRIIYENIQEFKMLESGSSIVLDCFQLFNGSKIIDFFRCSMAYNTTGIIISKRVKIIIEEFKLFRVQFIPCRLYLKNKQYDDYFLLHCYSYLLDKLDYDNMTFSRFWPYPLEVEEAYGKINEETLIRESDKIAGNVTYIVPDQNYIFKDFNYTEVDMFRIGYIDNFIYISKDLKEALVVAEVIGAEFVEANLF